MLFRSYCFPVTIVTETITGNNIVPFIVYKDASGAKFFLEGEYYTALSGNPVFRFGINSNYHIDKTNKIYISNFKDSNGNLTTLSIDLDSKLEIIYLSNVIPYTFAISDMDSYIQTSFLAGQYCAVTLEDVNMVFGHYLERLFSGMHTSTSIYDYQTYANDVPLTYTTTVYKPDNSIQHMPGDVVLDGDGNPVIQFQKGDVVLVDGDPVPISVLDAERYLNYSLS